VNSCSIGIGYVQGGTQIFLNSLTTTLSPQIFPDFLWLILVGIKVKTFDELSFVLCEHTESDSLGTNGEWLEYRNGSFGSSELLLHPNTIHLQTQETN
jgi:hypothetical protein